MEIKRLKSELKDIWKFAPDYLYLNRVNDGYKSRYCLILIEVERNDFRYTFARLENGAGDFYHNWSYYTSDFYNTYMPGHSYYCIEYKNLPIKDLSWRSFQSKETPKKNKLIVFKLLTSGLDAQLSGGSMYNLGYYNTSWFSEPYMSPSIPEKILRPFNANLGTFSHIKSSSMSHAHLKEYYKVPFSAIYKWCYFNELLNIIGDVRVTKMGLNYNE